jgi:hypothetical protein
MPNIKFYLVSYDRVLDRAVESLSEEDLKKVKCYAIQKKVPKSITDKIDTLNEWEMEWNDYKYQEKQYYEYGAIAHLTKNPKMTEGLTHVGLLHYDVKFGKESISKMEESLSKNPNKIYYNCIRGVQDLYLTQEHFLGICDFMTRRLGVTIDPNHIIKTGWVSEALSVTPIAVFNHFGKFLVNHGHEIEDILISNRWGIMNHINHRICGIVERMWGFYLISLKYEMEKMEIEHDWDFYQHQHHQEKNWITGK